MSHVEGTHGFYPERASFSPNGKRIVSGSHDTTLKIWGGIPEPWNDQGVGNNQPPPGSAKPAAEVSPPPDHVPLLEPARSGESDSASQPVRHGTARPPAAFPEVLGFSLAALLSVGLIALIALTGARASGQK